MDANFELQSISGLDSSVAEKRLKEDGFNEIPSAITYNFLSLIVRTISEPMFLLLFIGAVLYYLLGSKYEALLLLSFVTIIITITVRQEYKSEHALQALQKLSSPRALVIRDGKDKRIPGREVVREDIIAINEGDRVPADAILISSENLTVDEAVLTGESFPVHKTACENCSEIISMGKRGGEDSPFVFSGTYVTQGKGLAKVLETGKQTAIGSIGKDIGKIKTERTLLQKEADYLVHNFAVFGFVLCMLIAIIYGLTKADWLQGFLAGITLAMATLPEEIPVIITVFLALGAWRISLKQVLTRSAPAIEALGSITVLCADKTGTITQNRMSLKKLYADGKYFDLSKAASQGTIPENFHTLIEFSILASQRDPFDPMERAIKAIAERYLKDTEHIHKNWRLIRQYPLEKNLMAISLVWQSSINNDYIIAAKGAPETIFDLCHLDAKTTENFFKQTQMMANEGLRVLGIAKASLKHEDLPDGQHAFDFKFLGLIGLADPIRIKMPEAILNCYQAGIRIIMITGDYPGTAQNIARQIGLKDSSAVITGQEITEMSDLELEKRLVNANIFARILPDQKLRLVNALKKNGEIVAMTGDGINDTLALKTAHVGIAMGGRGTDVARESASLVLLDDDFSSIVSAIRLGRRIFDNIKKAIVYTISVHIPIIGLSVLPVILKMPLLLLPAHIVFLELIINPTCSIVFESEEEEPNVMRRPPRNPKEKLLNKNVLRLGLSQGFSIFGIAMLIFFAAKFINLGENITRAIVFSALVMENIALILVNLSWPDRFPEALKAKKSILWYLIGGALILLIAVLYVPFLRELFHFGKPSLLQLSVCLASGIFAAVWLRFIHAK